MTSGGDGLVFAEPLQPTCHNARKSGQFGCRPSAWRYYWSEQLAFTGPGNPNKNPR